LHNAFLIARSAYSTYRAVVSVYAKLSACWAIARRSTHAADLACQITLQAAACARCLRDWQGLSWALRGCAARMPRLPCNRV